jgi:hypothetical protein
MRRARDDARIGELFERLSVDREFRAAYRRDPLAACRALGLPELATPDDPTVDGVQRLEARASRSGMAGLVVAALMDAAGEVAAPTAVGTTGVPASPPSPASAGVVEAPSATAPSALHTGQSAVLAEAVAHASDAPASRYPGDDAPRREIARWMGDVAQRHGLPRELPVMAALVESDMRNVPYGDRASLGYFQMQTTYWLERYPGYPHKPELQLRWFVDQALAVRAEHPELAHDPQRWGEWVANVERPQESLRGRYADRLDDARALLRDAPHEAAAAEARVASSSYEVQRVPALRATTIAPHTGVQQLVDGPRARSSSGDVVDRLRAEAQRIDRAHVPYVWGGGHAGGQAYGSPVTPLDCSGAVSRVLGVDPRVASDFESWGAPGPGRRVTVFANDGHVLMEIDGHFWGTSAANPGGGAGWIPRSHVSDAYLARFTARHLPGQ